MVVLHVFFNVPVADQFQRVRELQYVLQVIYELYGTDSSGYRSVVSVLLTGIDPCRCEPLLVSSSSEFT